MGFLFFCSSRDHPAALDLTDWQEQKDQRLVEFYHNFHKIAKGRNYFMASLLTFGVNYPKISGFAQICLIFALHTSVSLKNIISHFGFTCLPFGFAREKETLILLPMCRVAWVKVCPPFFFFFFLFLVLFLFLWHISACKFMHAFLVSISPLIADFWLLKLWLLSLPVLNNSVTDVSQHHTCQPSRFNWNCVPSFEFQNLDKSGHSGFQEEKEKTFSFVKICSAGDH